jgi:hypothetical protein
LIATFTPHLASLIAVDAPIPVLAPVTSAVLLMKLSDDIPTWT